MPLFNKLDKDSKVEFTCIISDRTLDDYAGNEPLKEEGRKRLLQATQNYFLRDTEAYVRMLLEGPGGVGKSYFASCLAGEATRMILLNKKIEQKITSELADLLRPQIKEKKELQPKKGVREGLNAWLETVYFGRNTSNPNQEDVENQLKNFESVVKMYRDMLFSDEPGFKNEKEKFNKKVQEKYKNKLRILAKKKGVFSDNIKELEANLDFKPIDRKTNLKKAKDISFEEQILGMYSQYETGLKKTIEQAYHKNLIEAMITKIHELDIKSEEAKSLIKEFSSQIIETLERELGETKPHEVKRAKKEAWTSVVGTPQSEKDTVAYMEVNGADFAKLYVGTGSINVQKLFKEARKKAREHAAVVLNIEELDAVGSNRKIDQSDERRATLNKLLQEISGPNSDRLNKGIILVASTNLAEILDPAIIRSGRFGKPISVQIPNQKDLNKIIKYHFSQLKLDTNVDLDVLSLDLFGSTGADINELKKEAEVAAKMKKRTTVYEEDIRSALYRILIGMPVEEEFTEEDKDLIAFHEAGHALAIERKDRNMEVAELVLKGHGPAAAFVRYRLRKDRRQMQSREDFLNSLIAGYAGIIAEETMLGEGKTCSGARMDILVNTDKIKRGLRSGIFGNTYLNWDIIPNDELIAEKAQEIVKEVIEKTRNLIEENKEYLVALKEIGTVRGTLPGEEVRVICNLDKKIINKVVEKIKKNGCKNEENYLKLIHGKITPKEYP